MEAGVVVLSTAKEPRGSANHDSTWMSNVIASCIRILPQTNTYISINTHTHTHTHTHTLNQCRWLFIQRRRGVRVAPKNIPTASAYHSLHMQKWIISHHRDRIATGPLHATFVVRFISERLHYSKPRDNEIKLNSIVIKIENGFINESDETRVSRMGNISIAEAIRHPTMTVVHLMVKVFRSLPFMNGWIHFSRYPFTSE